MWLTYGSYVAASVADMLLTFGQHVAGIWMICNLNVANIRLTSGTHVAGIWLKCS